jgi:ketosteroid isomerase-like protein
MRTLSAVVLLTLTMVAGIAQQGASQSADESTIAALENAWNRALELHDAKAIADLVDDTLINVDQDNGHLENKAQYLARVRDPSPHDMQTVNEWQTVRICGSIAIVAGVSWTKGMQNGKAYLHRARFIDTWLRKDGKWVVVASQGTPILH